MDRDVASVRVLGSAIIGLGGLTMLASTSVQWAHTTTSLLTWHDFSATSIAEGWIITVLGVGLLVLGLLALIGTRAGVRCQPVLAGLCMLATAMLAWTRSHLDDRFHLADPRERHGSITIDVGFRIALVGTASALIGSVLVIAATRRRSSVGTTVAAIS